MKKKIRPTHALLVVLTNIKARRKWGEMIPLIDVHCCFHCFSSRATVRLYHASYRSKSSKLSTRHSNKRQQISLQTNWNIVIDPHSSKPAVVTHFKRILKQLSDSKNKIGVKDNETVNSLVATILNDLNILDGNSAKNSDNNLATKADIRKLYKHLSRGSISDNTLYEIINHFKSNKLTNVNIPSFKVSSISSRNGNNDTFISTNKKILPIEISHPTKNENGNFYKNNDSISLVRRIETQLNKNTHNSNELYQILNNVLEEFNEFKEKQVKNGKHSDIDRDPSSINIKSLQSYLSKLERQESEKNYVLKEQKRVYNWNQSVMSINNNMHAGNDNNPINSHMSSREVLSYFNIFNLLPKYQKSFSSNNRSMNRLLQKPVRKEFLVYNLITREKIEYKLPLDRLNLNIKYRDLFAIVNGSNEDPELTLALIKNMENKKWSLIGNLYDDNNKIIFQRSTRQKPNHSCNSFDNVNKGLLTVSTIGLLTIITWLLFNKNKENHKKK